MSSQMSAVLDFELSSGKNRDFKLADVDNYCQYLGVLDVDDYSRGERFETAADNRPKTVQAAERARGDDHFLYMFAVTKEKKAIRDGDFNALHFLNYMKGLI